MARKRATQAQEPRAAELEASKPLDRQRQRRPKHLPPGLVAHLDNEITSYPVRERALGDLRNGSYRLVLSRWQPVEFQPGVVRGEMITAVDVEEKAAACRLRRKAGSVLRRVGLFARPGTMPPASD